MSDLRRARGVHYTPAPVARYLAEIALRPWLEARAPSRRQLQVLDPACGDGALLEAARCVFSDWREARSSSDSTTLRLVGIDVTEDAVRSTRRRLESEALRGVTWDLAVGDALASPSLPGEPFDVVVGNPPYVFGEHLVSLDRPALAERYELGRRGQPDLFKLFYERTLGILAPNGRHAFLVPDALLARDEHADLRRLLARRLRVDRICQVGRVFRSAAGVSSVVVGGARAAGNDQVTIDRWDGERATRSHSLNRPWLIPSDGSPWSIDAPAKWFGPSGLRRRLEAPGVVLAHLLAPGPRGLTRGEELGKARLAKVAETPIWAGSERDAGCTPIYAGENVHRHWLAAPSRATDRAAVAKNPDYYAGPKILFVKTGAGPVASTCRDDLPVLQSVYTLHLADPIRERIDEDAVVAVLCSALLATYCWHTWTFGKRLQPQFTLGNLRRLPLPNLATLAAASGDLACRVRRIRGGIAEGIDVGPIERELDARVAQLYGLELAEWDPLMATALSKLPSSQRSRWRRDGRPI